LENPGKAGTLAGAGAQIALVTAEYEGVKLTLEAIEKGG
jgi:hypothetical protein